MSLIDDLRNTYLMQKLSLFFEKPFFFVFTNDRYPRMLFFEFLLKNKPKVLGFHFFKNCINLKNFFSINLFFVIKQFKFFLNSFFFKIRINEKLLNFNFFNLKINLFFYFFIFKKLFFKKFYRFLSFIFFSKFNQLNLIKFNFLFFIFLYNSNKFFKILNLNKFYDWCLYHKVLFKICDYKLVKNKIIFKKKTLTSIKYFKKKKFLYLKKIYNVYKKNYAEFTNWLVDDKLLVDKKKNIKNFKNIFLFRFKSFFFKKFNNVINTKNLTKINFSDSSMNKYISYNNLKKFNFFFLRKNRIFNKSRYSRNRQLYRTGFYWCLWLNIIIVYGLFFLFYRFTFNFGYIWWGLMFLFYSFIFSKVCKYNFYNIFTLINEFRLLLNWFSFLVKEIFFKSDDFTKPVLLKLQTFMNLHENFIYENTYLNNNYLTIFNTKLISLQNDFYNELILMYIEYAHTKKPEEGFLYEGYPAADTSFLWYKSIIHFFFQVIKWVDYLEEEREKKKKMKNSKKIFY